MEGVGNLVGLASLGGDIISGAGNVISQIMANRQNLELQKKEWDREDSAVQRRVADLEKAGLNRVLAASGAGAPTSLSARIEAPEVPMGLGSRAVAASLAQQQIAKTNADTKASELMAKRLEYLYGDYKQPGGGINALEAERQGIVAAGLAAGANADAANEIAAQQRIETMKRAHDWEIIKNTGVMSNVSGQVGQALNISQIVQSIISALRSKQGMEVK